MDSELNFKRNALENSEQRISENQQAIQQNQEEIKRLLQSAEVNEEELLELVKQKEVFEKDVNEAERTYYDCRGQIDQLEKDSREVQRNREQCDMLLMELNNQLNETKLQLSSVKERLSVEFNVNLEALVGETSTEDQEDQSVVASLDKFDEDELQQKVFKMRDS